MSEGVAVATDPTLRASGWIGLLVLFGMASTIEAGSVSHVFRFLPLYLGTVHVPPPDVPAWTGYLNAAFFLFGLPLVPFWGVWAERYGRVPIIARSAFVEAIEHHTLTVGIGPAGTGKTFLAIVMAVRALRHREVARIILSRPAVEAGEKLGFLPGDLREKVDPYLRPLYDALAEVLDDAVVARFLERGTIEVAPLAYMRGRTLADAFVILDEAQNATREQLKMFLTRLGSGSKMIVNGDVTQIDLPRGAHSGLLDVPKLLAGVEDIAIVELSETDVVRHPLVAKIVAAYARRS